jgi:hypothetical protein
MNLPVLPSDKLYKLKAVGGLGVVCAALYWVQIGIGNVEERQRRASEQIGILELDARFLDEDLALSRQTGADSTRRHVLSERERELERRLAVAQVESEALRRDVDKQRWTFMIGVIFSVWGGIASYDGFRTWSRQENISTKRRR